MTSYLMVKKEPSHLLAAALMFVFLFCFCFLTGGTKTINQSQFFQRYSTRCLQNQWRSDVRCSVTVSADPWLSHLQHLLNVKSLKYLSNLTLHDRITKSLLHLHKKKKPPSISAQFQVRHAAFCRAEWFRKNNRTIMSWKEESLTVVWEHLFSACPQTFTVHFLIPVFVRCVCVCVCGVT